MFNDRWTFISIKTRMLVDTFFMAIKVKFVGEIFWANLIRKFYKFGAKFFTNAYRPIRFSTLKVFIRFWHWNYAFFWYFKHRCFYAYKSWNFLITKKRFSGKTLIFLKFSTIFFWCMSSSSIAEYENIDNSIFSKKWYTCFIAITAACRTDSFICDNGTTCLPQKLVCNSALDCKDGADESLIDCVKFSGISDIFNDIFKKTNTLKASQENFTLVQLADHCGKSLWIL